ncbi:cytochrome P450 [Calocera viscosa TUFC12733]|uniref:Cytochrome P450 n=1 Tax=Calocera viscosa (strain TUFC12733) TaxID=1330018 RepID=A0A167P021_CALVF|nr:cytochrome P450 [Calocera viscosa TUFC12733]
MAMQISTLSWVSYYAFPLVLLLLAAGAVYQANKFTQRFRTPLQDLRGPPSTSFLWGNIREVREDDSIVNDWAEEYDGTFATRVLLGGYRLFTLDPRASSHILSHTDIYPKPDTLRDVLRSVIGDGLLVVEGDDHKRQRRIMNPSFSPGQIREVTPIFFDTARRLCDVFNSIIIKSSDTSDVEIDMYSWFGRATLDVIGQAGFGYHFNSMYDETNELYCAFRDMIKAFMDSGLLGILLNRFKILRALPLQHNRTMRRSQATTYRIGTQLVRAKKEAVQQEMQSRNLEKSKIVGRDLLSSLIRANMAADLSPAHRMSDDEVLAQISTFIVAGHETTSVGLSWTLLSLAQLPQVQDKLRAEVSLVAEEAPSMDELNALPYLDMVVKESLRYHAPVRGTARVATRADSIPLSRPIMDKHGVMHDHVRVQAGDSIGVETVALNHAKEFWGEDAREFRPERWAEEGVQAANALPGIYAHMMTFIGGPRACIGWRFSVIETKAILFTLIRSFEFSPVPGKEFGMKDIVVIRPFVKGEESKGFQLPLRVRKVQRAE